MKQSLRGEMESFICHSTREQVRIWWEPPSPDVLVDIDRVVEIRRGKVGYGLLGFTPGYLASSVMPGLAHCFASLCGLLMAVAEYEAFIDNQLAHLPSVCTIGRLTVRERDLLVSLAQGESEVEAAQRLGITPHTVRAHRHGLYAQLGVHTPSNAALRGFACRLFDMLDVPRSR